VELGKFRDIHPSAKVDKTTKIGKFVYIEGNVAIGKYCNIKHHVYICNGVLIEGFVFVGAGTKFINDTFVGVFEEPTKYYTTHIRKNVKIGANCTIFPVRIGTGSIIGAGSVVTKDVPPWEVWAGIPAKKLREI
jgi:acetyltransferase-like isoleucine patch superfamily enzyme